VQRTNLLENAYNIDSENKNVISSAFKNERDYDIFDEDNGRGNL